MAWGQQTYFNQSTMTMKLLGSPMNGKLGSHGQQPTGWISTNQHYGDGSTQNPSQSLWYVVSNPAAKLCCNIAMVWLWVKTLCPLCSFPKNEQSKVPYHWDVHPAQPLFGRLMLAQTQFGGMVFPTSSEWFNPSWKTLEESILLKRSQVHELCQLTNQPS